MPKSNQGGNARLVPYEGPWQCCSGKEFFAIIKQNALNYSTVFAKRDLFSSNRLTRLLSVPRNDRNASPVWSLVDYIRPEGQYDSSAAVYAVKGTCRIVRQPSTNLRRRTTNHYEEESFLGIVGCWDDNRFNRRREKQDHAKRQRDLF